MKPLSRSRIHDLPLLALPLGLTAGQVTSLHGLAGEIVGRHVFEPSADAIAAAAEAVTAPIPGRGSCHVFCGSPAQVYARLLALAAVCIVQAEAVLAAVEISADPMTGLEGSPEPSATKTPRSQAWERAGVGVAPDRAPHESSSLPCDSEPVA